MRGWISGEDYFLIIQLVLIGVMLLGIYYSTWAEPHLVEVVRYPSNKGTVLICKEATSYSSTLLCNDKPHMWNKISVEEGQHVRARVVR